MSRNRVSCSYSLASAAFSLKLRSRHNSSSARGISSRPAGVCARKVNLRRNWNSRTSADAVDATALYARNLLDFLKLIVDKEARLVIPSDDDIVSACLMTQGGEVKRKA